MMARTYKKIKEQKTIREQSSEGLDKQAAELYKKGYQPLGRPFEFGKWLHQTFVKVGTFKQKEEWEQ